MNTHRRAMRPVTPAVRAGRTAAGAAIAATMLFGGSAAATADGSTQADGAAQAQGNAAPAVLPAPKAEAVQLQSVKSPAKSAKTASVLSASKVDSAFDTESKAEADAKAKRAQEKADAEREAAEQAAADAAAQDDRAQDQSQDDQAEDQQSQSQQDDQSQESTSSHSSTSGSSSASSSSSSTSEKSTSDSSEKKSSAPAASSSSGNGILATARSGIGTPYVFGGTSTSGWDCSGFTQWVYAQNGISLPRTDSAQAAGGRVISKSEARPGDLMRKPGHVAIYAGGDMLIDAGNKRVGTTERHIYSGSWTYVTYTH
ncbi:C40 family peptidase [Brachybacterium sp. MASK1Z-5]|uniref:C40 family peptidase n=2 Tax=Brachybacterium halotolerans TaxID=2795215 RepID=A0ABS1BDK9_9MICO|nr:C40 family peptidase [Brachybacterium halotolerans]MBK0332734.1 C40 family peptidase [Brachybacterium halotolerans]